MAKERSYSRVHCRVDDFPDPIRAELDKMLAEPTNTYQYIVDKMELLGYEISKSSIGRYAMRTQAAASRLLEAAKQTQVLVEHLRDNQDVEATEVATAILMDGLTRRIATAEDEFDDLPIEKAGRLLTQIQRSSVYKNRFKKDRQKAIDNVERAIVEQLREQVRGDQDLLDKLIQMVQAAAREEAEKDASK